MRIAGTFRMKTVFEKQKQKDAAGASGDGFCGFFIS